MCRLDPWPPAPGRVHRLARLRPQPVLLLNGVTHDAAPGERPARQRDYNLSAVNEADTDPGVDHADHLRALTEAAIGSRWEELAAIRGAAAAAMGEQAMVDALTVAAGFNGITRVADATGSRWIRLRMRPRWRYAQRPASMRSTTRRRVNGTLPCYGRPRPTVLPSWSRLERERHQKGVNSIRMALGVPMRCLAAAITVAWLVGCASQPPKEHATPETFAEVPCAELARLRFDVEVRLLELSERLQRLRGSRPSGSSGPDTTGLQQLGTSMQRLAHALRVKEVANEVTDTRIELAAIQFNLSGRCRREHPGAGRERSDDELRSAEDPTVNERAT